ncbi:unnamed protein product [Effrenium voratum]|nr:unnamed protein product [Effrenium voratum]
MAGTPCVMCLAPATKQCSGCRVFWYCTRECQRKHWVNHKQDCGQAKPAPVLEVSPEELAEQERQFHTVTEIVQKHRETAKNKNVWVTRFGDKMYEDLEDARQASGIKEKLDEMDRSSHQGEAALNMLFSAAEGVGRAKTLAYFDHMKAQPQDSGAIQRLPFATKHMLSDSPVNLLSILRPSPRGPRRPKNARAMADMAVAASRLTFTALPGAKPILDGLDLALPTGARCLAVGDNGAGKSTLLQLVAGQKMAPSGQLRVAGEDPFRGRSHAVLVAGGWRGGDLEERMAQMKAAAASSRFLAPLASTDPPVGELLGLECAPEDSRAAKLFEVLQLGPLLPQFVGVLSEGQRRRAELFRRLGHERKAVVLLDEATAELDMLVRQELLEFLAADGCTVINVTHVFEGCAGWATHLLQLQEGRASLQPLGPDVDVFQLVTSEVKLPPRGPPLPRGGEGMAVVAQRLSFDYGAGSVLSVEQLTLAPGARCLLVGLNGCGKSTLLALLAGRRLCRSEDEFRVLGRRPFEDRGLEKEISVLSSEWKRQVQQLRAQLTFKELAESTLEDLAKDFDRAVLAQRLLRLIQMLRIQPEKSLGLLSDGELRRVQLAVKLLKPARLLLLDEVTADLDVASRCALLQFLREESEDGCAVVYCTHIMDGLQGWATHLLHLPGHLVSLEGGALSRTVLGLLRAARSQPAMIPWPRPLESLPALSCDEKGGAELPAGWHQRHAAQSGAFGNYAWQVETRPEEDCYVGIEIKRQRVSRAGLMHAEEWSFKSVAPEPSNKPPVAAAPDPLPFASAAPMGMPMGGVSTAAAAAMGSGSNLVGAGYPESAPEPAPRAAPQAGPADDFFGGPRMNQMSAEQLVALGVIPPER